MTTNKAAKRAVRARMAKTGERYAAARHHLLDRPDPSTSEAEIDEAAAKSDPAVDSGSHAASTELVPDVDPLPDPEAALVLTTAPGMSEAAIRRNTGKGWEEWFALLDAWGAAAESHSAIARHLQETHEIGGWWAQSVTVGWERTRGRRARHQHDDGFAVSVSRTFSESSEHLSTFFADETLRDRWLNPGTMTTRTVTPGRSARFDVATGGRLVVYLTAKGPEKTVAALQHEKLPDAAAVEQWRAFWKERLSRLGDVIREIREKG